MKEQEFGVQDIRELMSAMNKNQISALRVSRDGFTLELERAAEASASAQGASGAIEPAAAQDASDDPASSAEMVRSPLVGTFYASPAPGKPPFVTAGSKVKKGDVLFIIESMKLMNEVPSERDGVVGSILVENGQGVEYGQPILSLEVHQY